jgi:hypothetical protein
MLERFTLIVRRPDGTDHTIFDGLTFGVSALKAADAYTQRTGLPAIVFLGKNPGTLVHSTQAPARTAA